MHQSEEVTASHQFDCAGVVGSKEGVMPRDVNLKHVDTVPAIVTTFRDGYTRVSCPHFSSEGEHCLAGGLETPCPYSHAEPTEGDAEAERLANMNIRDMGFSVRTRNVLEEAGLVTARMIARRNGDDLLRLKHFGVTTLREVQRVLADKCNLQIKQTL